VSQAKDAIAAARAVEIYARETRASADILTLAFQIRSLAKRRLGEVVVREKAAGRLKEGRPEKTVLGEDRLSLADLGISKNESARAQEFASVSGEAFERMLGESSSGDLSEKALLRRIRAAKAEGSPSKRARKAPKAKDAPPPSNNAPPTSNSKPPPPTPIETKEERSLDVRPERAAERLEEILTEWKETYWEALLEKRVSAELNAIGEDVDSLIERMNEYAQSLGS
jgi:hypothetical protein